MKRISICKVQETTSAKTEKLVSAEMVERDHGRYLIKAGLLQNSDAAQGAPTTEDT